MPAPTFAVTAPAGSSAPSSTVATEKVADPDAGTVTDWAPRSSEATKAPVWATVTLTVNSRSGGGAAVSVNFAAAPSATAAPAETLTTGSLCESLD